MIQWICKSGRCFIPVIMSFVHIIHLYYSPFPHKPSSAVHAEPPSLCHLPYWMFSFGPQVKFNSTDKTFIHTSPFEKWISGGANEKARTSHQSGQINEKLFQKVNRCNFTWPDISQNLSNVTRLRGKTNKKKSLDDRWMTFDIQKSFFLPTEPGPKNLELSVKCDREY